MRLFVSLDWSRLFSDTKVSKEHIKHVFHIDATEDSPNSDHCAAQIFSCDLTLVRIL